MMKLCVTLLHGTILLFAGGSIWAQGLLPAKPPIPADNPQTSAKIELGRTLFFDPRLSSSGTVSCNSCHNVMSAGDDSRSVSVGIEGKTGGRSSPTVFNAAFLSTMFWDSRAVSLEEQAKGPLTNPVEMGMKDHDAVMAVVAAIPEYTEKFRAVFGGAKPVTIDNLAKAIAAYERTLVTNNSDYDKCLKGQKLACKKDAMEGLKVAQDVGCLACHNGANFSGPALPQGTAFLQKFPTFSDNEFIAKYKLMDDAGRFQVTKNEGDKHLWRVPTWRNVALTAPYFHNGAVNDLSEAVRIMGKTQLNKDLSDAQVKSIVAFLKSLSGTPPQQVMVRLPGTPGTSIIKG